MGGQLRPASHAPVSRKVFNAADGFRRHRRCRMLPADDSGYSRGACGHGARPQKTACDPPLARLRLFAGLSPAGSDRTRTRGALLQGIRAPVLWPRLARFLSRALEWRWLRSLLDADADRADVELRPLDDARSRSVSLHHQRGAPQAGATFPHQRPESANLRAVIRSLLILRAGAA